MQILFHLLIQLPPIPLASSQRNQKSYYQDKSRKSERVLKTERVARESGIENNISGGESDGAVAARTRGKKNEARLASDEGKINKRRRLVKGGRNLGAAVVAGAIENRSSPRLSKSSGLM